MVASLPDSLQEVQAAIKKLGDGSTDLSGACCVYVCVGAGLSRCTDVQFRVWPDVVALQVMSALRSWPRPSPRRASRQRAKASASA